MTLLVLGVVLFALVHWLPVVGRPVREKMVAAMGLGPYKGVFTLLIVGSIVLMVFGWRAVIPEAVYDPPVWGAHLALLLMFVVMVLFVASGGKSVVRQWIRHPMLTAMVLWAVTHLLANGENRSLVLFGGIGLWALLTIPLTNRRDGPRERPERGPLAGEIKLLVISAVVYAVVLFAHPFFTGVSPLSWLD